MIKPILLAAAASFAAPAAFAGGFYANIESNAGYTGDQYDNRTTDFHVGYESTAGSVDWYAQGGPAVVAEDGEDSDTRLSGKAGASIAATEKLSFYGEIAVLTAEDSDDDKSWSTKVGTTYKF